MFNETPSCTNLINRQQTFFYLPNIDDIPKQLTTTLTKPIISLHSQQTKRIYSPNDVVNKLFQTFNFRHHPMKTNFNGNKQKVN